jgi:hypothetical protein
MSAAVASSSVVVKISRPINRSRTTPRSRRNSDYRLGRPKRNDPLTTATVIIRERYNTKGTRRLGHDAVSRSCCKQKSEDRSGRRKKTKERLQSREHDAIRIRYAARNNSTCTRAIQHEKKRTRRLGCEVVGRSWGKQQDLVDDQDKKAPTNRKKRDDSHSNRPVTIVRWSQANRNVVECCNVPWWQWKLVEMQMGRQLLLDSRVVEKVRSDCGWSTEEGEVPSSLTAFLYGTSSFWFARRRAFFAPPADSACRYCT